MNEEKYVMMVKNLHTGEEEVITDFHGKPAAFTKAEVEAATERWNKDTKGQPLKNVQFQPYEQKLLA